MKDRVGRRIIIDAAKDGRLKEGGVVIEMSSGNTGIGLALTAAVRGYSMIITMKDRFS